jgi:N-acetylglucosamine-6-phosphate deacetylase
MSTAAHQVHRNARIHTLDPARPSASVLVVGGGTIAAVGDAELLDQVVGEPEIVDHGGAFLMPGLGDVHNHHMTAGRADLLELELDAATDLQGLLGPLPTPMELTRTVIRHALNPDQVLAGGKLIVRVQHLPAPDDLAVRPRARARPRRPTGYGHLG